MPNLCHHNYFSRAQLNDESHPGCQWLRELSTPGVFSVVIEVVAGCLVWFCLILWWLFLCCVLLLLCCFLFFFFLIPSE